MPSSSPIPEDILAARPYLSYIDRTSRGLGRYELTSFFAHPDSLTLFTSDIILHLSDPSNPSNDKLQNGIESIDAVVGLDALGFIVAGALGCRLGKSVICARKRGKLALEKDDVIGRDFEDYSVEKQGVKGLEIRKDLLRVGMKVLVVDEWIDSGAQMTATCEMLESQGVEVVGVATLQLAQGNSQGGDSVWERWNVFAANRSPVVWPPAASS